MKEKLTREELLAEYNLRSDYRNTFLTEHGIRVLQHLAVVNSVFREDIKADNPDMIGRANAIKGIFNMLSSLDDIPLSSDNALSGLIKGFTSVPILAHGTIDKYTEEENDD